MKIVNVEDGKEIIYVQNSDMMQLMSQCDRIPNDLISNIFYMAEENLFGLFYVYTFIY